MSKKMLRRMQESIVAEFCPAIVETKMMKTLRDMRYVLEDESNIKVTRVDGKFECVFKDGSRKKMVFDQKPSIPYYNELFDKPRDWSRHIAAVEKLRRQIVAVSYDCNPFRTLSAKAPDPPCKSCGENVYIDCGTHYTCKNCAVTRTKYEMGLDYRNIKERSQEQGDLNSCNWHTLDPLYSHQFNHQTTVGTASGEINKKAMSAERLNDLTKTMHSKLFKDVYREDVQIFGVRQKMEDICAELMLGDRVVNEAHVMFCKFRRVMKTLPREGDMIAACLFHSLPKEEVKIEYKPRQKRKLTPWNDSKKKRLKMMDLKKPIKRTKRRYGVYLGKRSGKNAKNRVGMGR